MITKITRSKVFFGILFLLAAVCAGIFFSPPDASAVQVKRVQFGDAYFDLDDMTCSVPIDAVNQSKSIILVFPNTDVDVTPVNDLENSLFTGTFESDTGLIISRDFGSVSSNARYYVIEFEDGVFVQRGTSSLVVGPISNPSCTTKNVTLPTSVDSTKSIALVNVRWYNPNTDSDEASLVTGTLTDDDTLQIKRDSSNDYNRILNIAWQVVEFSTDVEIVTNEILLSEASASAQENLSPVIASTEIDKCLLLFSSRGEQAIAGVEGRYAVRGTLIDNAGNIAAQFTHGYTEGGAPVDLENRIRYYVIHFTDPSTFVQRSTTALTSGNDDVSASLTPTFDSTRTFPVSSVSGPNNTTNTYEDEIRASVDLNNIKGECYAPTATAAIWVAKEFSNKVYKYDANTGVEIGSYDVGTRPVSICYDSANTAVWIANYGSDNVTELNANNGTLIRTVALPAGAKPMDLTFDSSTNSIWTANYGTFNITKITAATGVVVGSYSAYAAARPSTLCFNPTAPNEIWVAYWYGTSSDRISRFTCATGANAGNTDYGTTNQNYSRIRWFDTTATVGWPTVWLCNLRGNSLIRIRASAIATYATYYPDLQPQAVTYDGTNIWTVHYANNILAKMDIAGNVSNRYDTGSNPFDVVYGNSHIWVSNLGDLTVQKFTTAGAIASTINVPSVVERINFSRRNTTGDINISWFVTELTPVTIKSPNGTEVWHVGDTGATTSTGRVTWKHAEALIGKTVDIKLSYDGGTTYPLTIASAISATQDYWAWPGIPDTESGINLMQNDLRIRVIVTGTTTTDRQYDDSNGNFEIKGTVTVTQPNNGEVWYVGDTNKIIRWDKAGNFDPAHDAGYSFSMKLSETGGSSYLYQVVTGLLQADVCSGNSCQWTWEDPDVGIVGIPDKIGNDRRIQVYLNNDESNVHDESNVNFYIKGVLAITAPNGPEEWLAQTHQNITWNKKGTFATVTLKYSKNSGADYFDTIAANQPAGTTTGTYDWDIPVAAISTTIRVKVISDQATDLQVEDASDANFKVLSSVELLTPTTGATWTVTDPADITWQVNGVMANVALWWSKDGNAPWHLIAHVPSVPSAYNWSAVDEGMVGSSAKIKVAQYLGDDVNPITPDSDSPAFIVRPKLTLLSPVGGENWLAGTSHDITWSAKGTAIGNVRIKYAPDGSTFSTIAELPGIGVPASDGTWTWPNVPVGNISNTGKIYIELINDTSINKTSPVNFTIGTLDVTHPINTDIWTVGDTTRAVTWTYQKFAGNIQLKYSVNGGGDSYINSITNSVAINSLSYTWNPIPDAIGNNLLVKAVLVSSDPIPVENVSPTAFTIKGGFTFTSPLATDKWVKGSSHSIDWITKGTIAQVNLYWNTNGGSYTQFATELTNGFGFNWTVPDALGPLTKIKVSTIDSDPIPALTESDNFTIKGSLQVTSPTTGDVWYKGDTNRSIGWIAVGTVTNVKIEYKTSLGGSYTTIIANDPSHTEGSNSYVWSAGIPDEKSDTCYIRVSDVNNTEVEGISEMFSLRPKITLSAPVAGTNFTVQSSYPNAVQWSLNGSTKVSTVNVF
ncbi:MAG: hypothetical protein WDL87_00745 [Candidatus Omnitrophota bacterium]|jgi:hypothetical protein